MCWCDDFEFTINRADEYMVKSKRTFPWYTISPPDVMTLILKAIEQGSVTTEKRYTLYADEVYEIVVRVDNNE